MLTTRPTRPEADSVPKKMSKFKNVINECLVEADPSELEELHLLMEVGNHHYKLPL